MCVLCMLEQVRTNIIGAHTPHATTLGHNETPLRPCCFSRAKLQQEVTMDGSTVLKKGGPSFFGYRRKGPYRLLATRNGFKVERRGNVRWTVTANDKEDYVVP